MHGSPLRSGLTRALASWLLPPLLAFGLLAGAGQRARAQGDQPSLELELAGQAPVGFDRDRLQQRVAVYLQAIVAIAWADADADASRVSLQGRKARFVARLQWPQGAMTPLRGQVLDLAFSPARRYELDVSEAQSWEELERLVALKLGSILRTALAQVATEPEPKPEPAPELAPAPEPVASRRVLVELGGGVFTRAGFAAPRLGGSLRGGFAWHPWAFGIAMSLSARRTDADAARFSDALESSWAASVHYDLLTARSRWLLQLGAQLGLFVARVEASRGDQARVSYAVSPLSALSFQGGYRLSGRLSLLFGPALDVLWNRSEISAGGVQVYDSGRLRPRVELKLMLGF